MAGIEASVSATFVVNDAVTAAAVIAEKLPETVSRTMARRVYQVLLIPALENAKERGYSPKTGRITFHCPAEIIAKALGISRMSLWRAVQVLKSAGLIDNRAHKGSCRGQQVRNTGSLWCIRLSPCCGSKAKLTYEELRHRWRPNFDQEVRQGKGSYQAVKTADVTYKRDSYGFNLDLLLRWAVDSKKYSPSVDTSVSNKPNPVLETLLDVATAKPGKDTVQMVDLAAQALATALADHTSTDFYRLLVWRCLRASQRGLNVFPMVYQMAVRARVDYQENWSRRGGAVYVDRLKKTAFWEELVRIETG